MNDDVSLTSNEHDLRIVYGPDFFPDDSGEFCSRETALGGVKYIFTDISDIKRSFFRLGFHLYEFDRLRYYEDFGFSSLAGFLRCQHWNGSFSGIPVCQCVPYDM